MAVPEAVAFWSYAHADDENDGGAVLGLANLIRAQYMLITGESLRLFVDADIGWGDLWKARIENALIATTFFIPILTPTYFKREQCRKELFDFARHAEALNVKELICPILYAPVENFTKDNADPAITLCAQAQYENWTELRLCDVTEATHKRAVKALVERLSEVGRMVGSRQATVEATQDEEGEKAGLSETLDAIEALLREWLDAIERDGLVREQFLSIDVMLEERKRRLRVGPAGARYAVFRRQVEEYLPLLERRQGIAQVVLRKTVELSPLIARAVRIAAAHPEDDAPVRVLGETFEQAVHAYKKWDVPMEPVAGWARRNADKTRGMLTLARVAERNEALLTEVRDHMGVWAEELEGLRHETDPITAAGENAVTVGNRQAATLRPENGASV